MGQKSSSSILEYTFTSEYFFRLIMGADDIEGKYLLVRQLLNNYRCDFEISGHTLIIVSNDGPKHNKYRISIIYSKMFEIHNECSHNYANIWFTEPPNIESVGYTFINCVFDCDIDYSGVPGAVFQNCVFVKSFRWNKASDFLWFQCCLFGSFLNLMSFDINKLVIYSCSSESLIANDMVVNNFKIDIFHVKTISLIDCEFKEEFFLSEISAEHIWIEETNVTRYTTISNCLSFDLILSVCNFNNLALKSIYIDNIVSVEDNHLDSENDSCSRYGIIITGCDIKGYFEMSFIFVPEGRLLLRGCSFRSKTLLSFSPDESFEFPRTLEIRDEDFDVPYNISELRIDHCRFFEECSVSNDFQKMSLSESIFLGKINIDIGYFKIVCGNIIKRIPTECRLLTDSSDDLFVLSENEYVHRRYLESGLFYIAGKIKERESSSSFLRFLNLMHGAISDYGKSPTKVLMTVIMCIACFSVVYYILGVSPEDCLFFSSSSFFTIGFSIGNVTLPVQYVAVVEGGLGFVLMSYFLAVSCVCRCDTLLRNFFKKEKM